MGLVGIVRIANRLWFVCLCLTVTGCRTSGVPSAGPDTSALIDPELACLLHQYYRARRDYQISGHEGTAMAEGKAHRALTSYIRDNRKQEALITYMRCVPDDSGAEAFRATILYLYIELKPGDHTALCREILAKRFQERIYDESSRVHAAIYLARREDPRSLQFALSLLASTTQRAENEGISIVRHYDDGRLFARIPVTRRHLPDPWEQMDNRKLALEIASYLRKELGIVADFAPGSNEE